MIFGFQSGAVSGQNIWGAWPLHVTPFISLLLFPSLSFLSLFPALALEIGPLKYS